jgi:predicted ATPase
MRLANAWSFRGDAPALQMEGDLTTIVGRNNSGKSSLLRAIRWFVTGSESQPTATEADRTALMHISGQMDYERFKLNEPNAHALGKGRFAGDASVSVEVSLSKEEVATFQRQLAGHVQGGNSYAEAIPFFNEILPEAIDEGLRLTTPPSGVVARGVDAAILFMRNPVFAREERDPFSDAWKWFVRPRLTQFLLELMSANLVLVSGARSLHARDATTGNLSIVEALREMKAPKGGSSEPAFWFREITEFFGQVTGLHGAELIVTSGEAPELHILFQERYLSIGLFGDGIKHLLILAFFLMRSTGQVLLIEEPETHLHPQLQRHLLDLLRRGRERHQVVLTTHSPVLLDRSVGQILHIEYDGGQSSVSVCHSTKEHLRLLDDLDARASDILQAPVVIWVEGPTDRMFLERCFELMGLAYRQGIHYQIVPYGGGLLSHLTLDERCAELVNLLPLSRHPIVVCDSDLDDPGAAVSDAKCRVERECHATNGLFWLTDGREVENYIADAAWRRCYERWFGAESANLSLGLFEKIDDALARAFPNPVYGTKGRVKYGDHKVELMAEVLPFVEACDLEHRGLLSRLEFVAAYIRMANPPAVTPA